MERFRNLLIETSKTLHWRKSLLLAVLISFVWSVLWFWPWQTGLQDFIWLRLGIALAIFILPGLSIYGLLSGRGARWTDYLPFGFVISHLLIAAAGTLGRLVHVSFGLISDLMMVAGLVLLLFYLLPLLSSGISFQINRASLGRIVPALPVVVIGILASLIVIQRVLSDDDLTYLAYLTEWQHSPRLDFRDVIFGTAQIVQPRFWLVSTPFAQAFLARLSRLPGIFILGGYYEPFLVFLSMLTWYNLARTLQLSRRAASISVILQMAFLLLLSDYLHPGASFFSQLSVDKATASFIVAPAFIQSELRLLRDPARKNALLCLLAGLSLMFMHPIALAYSILIGGLILILNMDRGNLRSRLIPFGILLLMLIPQAALRFVPAEAEQNIPYGIEEMPGQRGLENMISRWGDSPFYGFNPDILSMAIPYGSRVPLPGTALAWGWLVIPILAALLSIRQIRRSHLAQYIFSGFLLCALAGFPLTGWILGYFLSAWMLERTTWLFPYGLSAVYLILTIRDQTAAGTRLAARLRSPGVWLLIGVALCSSALFLLFMHERGLPDFAFFGSKSQRYLDLSRAGQYLDEQIPVQAVVVGTGDLNDLLPGLSWKAGILTFRTSDPSNMPFFSLEAIDERIADRAMILSRRTPPEVRLSLLRKYDVRFLLLRKSDYALFKNLISKNLDLFEIKEIGRYIVVRFRQ